MQISTHSQLTLNELKGALLTNEHGVEFRIHDFYVNINDLTNVLVSVRRYDREGNLEDFTAGLYLSEIKDWIIQIQRVNLHD